MTIPEKWHMEPSRVAMYFTGCFLFAVGVKLFITSQLGTDPFNAMVIGIVDIIGSNFIKIGVISGGITLVALGIWSWWNSRWPIISPFITMALVGFLIDFLNELRAERLIVDILSPYAMLVTGLVIDAYASSLIIMSGFGIRIMDLIAITFVEKLGWKFTYAKLLLEVGFVCVAWVCAGPIGVATLLFVVIVCFLIEPFMLTNAKVLNLRNYGVPSPRAANSSGSRVPRL